MSRCCKLLSAGLEADVFGEMASYMEVMENIDFTAPAEMYTAFGPGMRNRSVKFRRFASGAEAIQFAIESQDGKLLNGTVIEVEDQRLAAAEIRALYDSDDYPLPRKSGT